MTATRHRDREGVEAKRYRRERGRGAKPQYRTRPISRPVSVGGGKAEQRGENAQKMPHYAQTSSLLRTLNPNVSSHNCAFCRRLLSFLSHLHGISGADQLSRSSYVFWFRRVKQLMRSRCGMRLRGNLYLLSAGSLPA